MTLLSYKGTSQGHLAMSDSADNLLIRNTFHNEQPERAHLELELLLETARILVYARRFDVH